MKTKTVRHTCSRCGRTGRDRGNWNFEMHQGVPVAIICPACQTAEENAEAEINEATLDYIGTDAFGRAVATSKA
ncbi:hypothetical protein B7R22_05450 [Subtercola boreus]|uniref:Uncharacterized protein n=1 Tax=Subtercola boreus TaxID=120213 RepID=A0A3E0W2W9_9MICO|nr:hypothetical protein [Subtercola boreus]RFA15853.1 hypothetical protein B7R22_05450 [Subtercola boreus]